MYVLKLGGSLLTHKHIYCTPNDAVLDAYARTLARHWESLHGRLVLVIGGGSFGNSVPLKYNIADAAGPWAPRDVMKMTTKMFEWLSIVANKLRTYGVPAYPLQASSWITTHNGAPESVHTKPILHALELGLLPLLSGDLVFDAKTSFLIFSSDNIPEIIARTIPIRRVAMLTDVPGILASDQSIVPVITEANMTEVLQQAGSSSYPDVTGGMRNKLLAALRLATSGVESVICDGRDPEILLPALLDDQPPGTVIRFAKNS